MNKTFRILTTAAFFGSFTFAANAFETTAHNAILTDYDTGAYLYTKNHDQKMAPASMSKLMTLYILFEKLSDGSLSLDDTFTVSENAWRKGGASSGSSTMFLKIGEKVRVEDLIKGIIIQSGNDACIVVAENIAGTEEDFAEIMNDTAQKIGLKNSSFANSTGWPHPDQKMSVEDLAVLAREIIRKHGEYYHIFSEKNFTHNGIKQGNRNPLLYSMEGADGLKTGHTDEAGFCLTASAERNGRRLIAVMSGMSSNKERAKESERLMSYGFMEFNNYTLLKKGDELAEIPVWYGKEKTVRAVAPKDIVQTMPRKERRKYAMKVVYDEPLKAPIKEGSVIAKAEVSYPDGRSQTYDLVADRDVDTVGLGGKFIANIKYLLFGAK